jgi:hypothetical protein
LWSEISPFEETMQILSPRLKIIKTVLARGGFVLKKFMESVD